MDNNKKAIVVLDDFFGDDKLTHDMSAREAWDCIKRLLKEQEVVVPCLMQNAKGIWNTCGKCGHILKSAFLNPMEENNTFFYYPRFCSECGQAVKWNEINRRNDSRR